MGFGGLITGLGIAGFAALAGGVSLGCIGVVVCVLSCRGFVGCSVFCSASGAGIFGFITGRGITGFIIGLLTGGCSDFVSAAGSIADGISVVDAVSFFILSSVTGFGFITGLGITGLAAAGLADGVDDAGNISAGVVSPAGGAVGSLGFIIIGRATTGFGLGSSVSVLSTEVFALVTGGTTGNFVSTDFKISGNATIAC